MPSIEQALLPESLRQKYYNKFTHNLGDHEIEEGCWDIKGLLEEQVRWVIKHPKLLERVNIRYPSAPILGLTLLQINTPKVMWWE